MPEILEVKPIGLEGLDDILVRDMKTKGIHPQDVKLLPPGGGWLLVEFGGETKEEADEKADGLKSRLKAVANPPSMKLFDDEAEEEHLWKVRESGLGATARIPGHKDAWEGWEDSAVHPHKLKDYLLDLRKLLTEVRLRRRPVRSLRPGRASIRSIDFDLKTVEGVGTFASSSNEAADMIVRVRRVDLGRARRRPVQGGALAQDVRARAGPRLRRVQGDLGPGEQDEPAPGGRPALPGENLRHGAELSPDPGEDALPVPRRPRQLRVCDRALRRRGRVPQGRIGHDVPQLHGHQGGDALDPRPRPPALRDAPGRPDEEAVEGRAGPRGARPLPGLQGMQDRVPAERRHGDLQGRVPLALLRGAVAAEARLRDGLDLLVGAAGLVDARVVNVGRACSGLGQAAPSLWEASRASGKMPTFATETFKDWWRRRPPRNVGWPTRHALGRYVQQPFPPADAQGGRRGTRGRRAST